MYSGHIHMNPLSMFVRISLLTTRPPGGITATRVRFAVEHARRFVNKKKRKETGEEYLQGQALTSRSGTPLARMADMPSAEVGGGAEESSWRAYYEHPLTAATTAMLNISGAGADDQSQGMSFIYECYKLPQQLSDKDKLAEIWPTTSTASGGSLLTSQVKTTNGLGSGAGLELIAPPTSSTGLSGTSSSTIVASAAELQGLFLHQQQQQQQQQLHHSHLHHVVPQLVVKREPEDLSHHRHKSNVSPGLDTGGGIIINNKGARHKVVLVSTANGGGQGDLAVDVVNSGGGTTIKEELSVHRGLGSPQHGSRSINGTPSSTSSILGTDTGGGSGPVELITGDPLKPSMYGTQIFAPMTGGSQHHGGSGTPSPIPYSDHVPQYTTAVSQGGATGYITTSSGNIRAGSSTAFAVTDPYPYREYFTTSGTEQGYAAPVRQQIPSYADSPEGAGGGGSTTASNASFVVERYVRQSNAYGKSVVSASTGLTVDLPSPDSGIGTESITPRDQTTMQPQFDYADLVQSGSLMTDAALAQRAGSTQGSGQTTVGSRSRPWHDFGRQNDADKIQIPKIYSPHGFKYHLEAPISTSQRREDDRITYINKGQFYGITMEYVPDPDKPLKTQTVKSVVMLMFREEKSPEDEIKAWQFWHGRQHSVKQRILDADTKNSVGLVGCIEEVAHNAIAVYWNPMESSAKISIAVQCLSTDFSSQKGVKGLPLHLQIDTYEDPRDGPLSHRGYCQIKVFCDKGAERKTRDEERRAAKRKMTATGRKKLDELYHPAAERSEFYAMSDLTKPPVLFSPAEDIDKVCLASMELGFYSHETDSSSLSNGEAGSGSQHSLGKQSSPFLLHSSKPSTTPTLKFHNHFPPDVPGDKKEVLDGSSLSTDGSVFSSPPQKRHKLMAAPPLNERVMLYVRQDNEEVYTPLHVVPPTTQGLLNAIENKYKISTSSISNLYRKNKEGIIAKIDNDMLKYYCNEDLFLLEIKQVDGDDCFEVTLVELMDH
ncbi:protein grainyhead [Anabrus simplex]|uniref:protein grainyhead n=1 Tax=Anabrus simplex TaxID=316456 RepID=UPI0035A2AB1A